MKSNSELVASYLGDALKSLETAERDPFQIAAARYKVGEALGLLTLPGNFAQRVAGVKETFELMSDEQRLELIHSCCTECGAMDSGCQCWNDE